MPHFLLRLVPPRPTFHLDMTEVEAEAMELHAAYLRDLVAKGVGVAFGPVFDPNGVWGLGIVEAEDEAAVRAMADADPVAAAGIGRYEIVPMKLSMLRGG